jgi:CheY-like chemotaxis protein
MACTVLLVEDHDDTREVMGYILEGLGYEVRAAGTAAEALQIAARQKLDIVISDIGLPDSPGTVLMRELKSNYGLKGIALSGYGRGNDSSLANEAAFDAHLLKPVDYEVLERTVRRLTAPK